MTAHEVLVKARNLIADEKDWTCSGVFRTAEGRYCATGAVMRTTWGREPLAVGENPTVLPAWSVLYDAMQAIDNSDHGAGSVNTWNDEHTHAEVLAAFDKAIAATAPEPDVSFVTEPVAVA